MTTTTPSALNSALRTCAERSSSLRSSFICVPVMLGPARHGRVECTQRAGVLDRGVRGSMPQRYRCHTRGVRHPGIVRERPHAAAR